MRIANPLFDYAFKYLMSNERLAKKVLSTILEKEILEIELEQQEIVVEDEIRNFTLYRLDFKALIKNENGEVERVLIEIQKSKLPNNLLRFRSYLGHSYLQKSERLNPDTGRMEPTAFPIISIYILGYQIQDIPVLATKIDRKVVDVSSKQVLELNSDFINLLTHTCYVLQAGRLPEKRKTKIERFMSLFNQAWVSEKKYILDLEDVPEEFSDIALYLQKPLNDKQTLKKLEAEQEFEDMFAKQESDMAVIRESLQKEREQKELALVKADEAQKKAEDAQRAAESNFRSSVKIAKKYGASAQQIADDLQVPLEKVLAVFNETN